MAGPAPPPKQEELVPHPVKDQLPNVSFCITSPPPWRKSFTFLSFLFFLVLCWFIHLVLTLSFWSRASMLFPPTILMLFLATALVPVLIIFVTSISRLCFCCSLFFNLCLVFSDFSIFYKILCRILFCVVGELCKFSHKRFRDDPFFPFDVQKLNFGSSVSAFILLVFALQFIIPAMKKKKKKTVILFLQLCLLSPTCNMVHDLSSLILNKNDPMWE